MNGLFYIVLSDLTLQFKMDNLIISTININGFRSKLKQDYVKNYIKQNHIDVLCVQETFIDIYFLSNKIDNE